MHLFGAHTIDNGGIHMAARRAGNGGMKALQIFTAVPKFYNEKISVKPERVTRFSAALKEANISPKHVVAHSAYVLSVATPEPDKYARGRAALAKELERSTALGLGSACFHPGSAHDSDPRGACQRVGEAIAYALETVPGETRLLIENTAGVGRTMGRTAEEIAEMLSYVPKELRARTGYGLDTCHLYASGHDLAMAEPAPSLILDMFEQAIGEPPSFFHFNDSEHPLGSNRDRHALLGKGTIGAAAFGWLLKDRRTQHVPIILETPQANFEIAEDDATPDPWDVEMMELLRGLAS
jgi:deoxyribonuclease-4